MRKFWVAGTAVMLVLALAAVAIAQEVTNTYTVTGSTSPSKAGSKKKPLPISINFNYSVGEVNNNRPSVIRKYSIKFAGTQVNTNVAKACPQNTIEQKGPSGCDPKSIIGTGYIENETGDRERPEDKSISCNAKLTVINVGNRKANIFVEGDPNATDPREKCQIPLSAGIPANFVRTANDTSLVFEVPESLRHPLPTLSNAVKRVQSNIKRITKKINGKTRGYFEAIGQCKNGKRFITVTFTPEEGSSKTAQTGAKCTA